jgi:hypothetical protein
MFKKIFKAAKDLIRSPVGQLGIGLLAPQLSFLKGVSPALIQGGIGLLSGAKPEEILKGVAMGAGSAALMGGRGGISDFFMGQQPATRIGSALNTPQSGGSMTINPNTTGNSLTFGDASAQGYAMNANMPTMGASSDFSLGTIINQAKEDPNFLEKFGLINRNGENFFETYGPLLKLGQAGAAIAAAALGEDQAQSLYDPNQNPYLTGDTKITDVYTPLEYNKGGILDFPEKDGMINGPGNGQSDDIPAMLSDGEFVMTKQAVMAAGNGDRDQGTKKMYSMMNNLENKADSMGIGRM